MFLHAPSRLLRTVQIASIVPLSRLIVRHHAFRSFVPSAPRVPHSSQPQASHDPPPPSPASTPPPPSPPPPPSAPASSCSSSSCSSSSSSPPDRRRRRATSRCLLLALTGSRSVR